MQRRALPDPTVCPLCGGTNDCALAAAQPTSVPCWCAVPRATPLDASALARAAAAQAALPPAQRCCVCAACAGITMPAQGSSRTPGAAVRHTTS